jgi:hypothetical protein
MIQASSIESYLATPIGLVIGFVALWCASCYLISFSAGWFALSRRFKKQSEPYGEIRSAGPFFYTVYMRFWCHFTCLISLTAASDALYVSILFPFRIGHPPLRIPWDEIRFSRTKYFFRTYIALTLGNEEKIPLRIPLRMARNLGILDRANP